MKAQDILNQTVNVFKSSDDSGYVYYTSTFLEFLQKQARYKKQIMELREINKTDEDAAKKYKKEKILACTPSATFNKRRVTGDVKEKTDILIIDIDKDRNPGLDVEKAKLDVMKLPYVFMTMISCRGDGIWAGIYYNKNRYIGYVFDALKVELRELGYVIDNCRDVTRLRIMSWDDNILIKDEVEMYDKEMRIERDPYANISDWVMTKEDVKDICKCVYVLVNYDNYTADNYDAWLLDGFRLATMPNKDVGLKLFNMISEHSDNYKGYEDVEEKFEECYRTTTYTTSILGYYINLIKEIYGNDWRKRINEIIEAKQSGKS